MNCIIYCNIVPYSYISHVLLLHILYIQLQTLKCMNCIINCNIVPYSYFPYVMLLHILHIHLQILKCINCVIETLKCIKCNINCNIVPYSYISHVLLLHILYIHLQTLKYINCIINCNIAVTNMSLTFYYYISCIYTYKFWNVLTVLYKLWNVLNVILSHIHISLMFCYYVSCIYTYILRNLLTVLLTVILPLWICFSYSVTIYPVYTQKNFEIYYLYYEMWHSPILIFSVTTYPLYMNLHPLQYLWTVSMENPILRFVNNAKYTNLKMWLCKTFEAQ